MRSNKGIMAPMQVGIEDFKGVFQDRIRTMVQQECLVHGERVVCAKLSYKHQPY
jgi:hypothetical protein